MDAVEKLARGAVAGGDVQEVLFGTYTRRESRGIYHAVLDRARGRVSAPELLLALDDPTYLCADGAGGILAVAKSAARGVAEGGLVRAALERVTSGGLAGDDGLGGIVGARVTGSCFAPGPNPCYVSADASRCLAFSANYHFPVAESYALGADGSIARADSDERTGGGGPRPEQQDGAHLHFAGTTPDGRLAVVDLGSDMLLTYDVDDDGSMHLADTLSLPAGFGPRHLAFSPDGSRAYLAAELSNQLAVLGYDEKGGTFSPLSFASTLPAGFDGWSAAAAVRVSGDGRFVYVSNRGHDSIAVFAVEGDAVSPVQFASTAGSFPRDFALDATGRFLLVAHQKSDGATLFSRDEETGELTELQRDIPVPEGVCVLFL